MRDAYSYLGKLSLLSDELKQFARFNSRKVTSTVDEAGGRDDNDKEQKLQSFLDEKRKQEARRELAGHQTGFLGGNVVAVSLESSYPVNTDIQAKFASIERGSDG